MVLGRIARIIGAVLLTIVIVIAAGFLLGVFGVPTLESVDNSFAEVNETTTVIETEVTVNNPNPVGTGPLGLGAEYEVMMNDVRIAEGKKASIDIGSGTSTVTIRTYMDNEKIPEWWVTHIENGEKTEVTIEGTVSSSTVGVSRSFSQSREIETDILSGFKSDETREIESDKVPAAIGNPILYVNETDAAWGEVSDEETPINMEFVFYNPKPLPVAITQISYDITMNGLSVGEGTTDRAYTIPPQESQTVEATTIIDNQRLDEWWVSHIRNDQVTNLKITFNATFEIKGQTIEVPLETLTYEKRIETNFFGSGESSSLAGQDDSETMIVGGSETVTDLQVGSA